MELQEAITIIDSVSSLVDPEQTAEFYDAMRVKFAEDIGNKAIAPAVEEASLAELPSRGPVEHYTMGTQEAANYLGISLCTIRRWTDQGIIDHIRTPGKQRRFSREGLRSFTERSKVNAS